MASQFLWLQNKLHKKYQQSNLLLPSYRRLLSRPTYWKHRHRTRTEMFGFFVCLNQSPSQLSNRSDTTREVKLGLGFEAPRSLGLRFESVPLFTFRYLFATTQLTLFAATCMILNVIVIAAIVSSIKIFISTMNNSSELCLLDILTSYVSLYCLSVSDHCSICRLCSARL